MPLHTGIDRFPDLPSLAWVLRRSGDRLDVGVGDGVRVGETSLFEGGFALTEGPDEARLDGIYCGSGATWRDGKLKVIAPSHTLDSVWVAETAEGTWASNSLQLLIAAARPSDFNILAARFAIQSWNVGISTAKREIHNGPDARVYRFCNAIVEIDTGSTLTERRQEQALLFSGYATYVAHLERVIGEVVASSGSTECASFLSTGYDSPACAVLARAVAPTTAVCLDKAEGGEDDDGSRIAETLGLPAVRLRRGDPKVVLVRRGDKVMPMEMIRPEQHAEVCEFFNGYSIAEVRLGGAPDALAGRVVTGGWTGGKMWAHSLSPWADLRRVYGQAAVGDLKRDSGEAVGGDTFGEYRRRIGFTLVVPPMIAFNHAAVVHAIGLSDEMRPWRVGGDYDRPVPRRLIEEAGVPRNAFGQRKQAATTRFGNLLRTGPTLFGMQVERYRPAMSCWAAARPAA